MEEQTTLLKKYIAFRSFKNKHETPYSKPGRSPQSHPIWFPFSIHKSKASLLTKHCHAEEHLVLSWGRIRKKFTPSLVISPFILRNSRKLGGLNLYLFSATVASIIFHMAWILGSSHPEHFKGILANAPITMTYKTGHHIPVTHQDMPSFVCSNNLERSDHFSKNFKTIDLSYFCDR